MTDSSELEHIASEIRALEDQPGTEAPAEAPAGEAPTFNVADVQQALVGLGCSPANGRPAWQPGTWDAQSTEALKEAQLRLGLTPTGNVDPDTLKALGL
jgi:murein L,D-transpeptidase YcbB/YkuD